MFYLVKSTEGKLFRDGMLCRTEQSRDESIEFLKKLGVGYVVEETNTVVINDPMEQ